MPQFTMREYHVLPFDRLYYCTVTVTMWKPLNPNAFEVYHTIRVSKILNLNCITGYAFCFSLVTLHGHNRSGCSQVGDGEYE